jgi:abequosyltransferase
MRHHGLQIAFVRDPLVRRRGENDSFADRGIVPRYALAIDGYTSLVGDIFGYDGIEYRETLRILRNEFTIVMFMYAKQAAARKPEQESLQDLERLFDKIYPRSAEFALVRLAFRLPATTFISAFEAANAVRHRVLGRTA